MKCNQSGPGFELVSPCPYPATITSTPREPPTTYTLVSLLLKRDPSGHPRLRSPTLLYLHVHTYLYINKYACSHISDFETNANVLKCLQLMMLFIETNLKSKRYTIHQSKHSFLQSNNVDTKVTSFCNASSPDDGIKLGRKNLGNNKLWKVY